LDLVVFWEFFFESDFFAGLSAGFGAVSVDVSSTAELADIA